MKSPQLKSYLPVKNWKPFLQDQEQDKDAHSHHFLSTQYWKSWPEQLGKKKMK